MAESTWRKIILTFGLLLTMASGLGWVAADALRKRLASRLTALELAVGLHLFQIPLILIVLAASYHTDGASEFAQVLTWKLESQYWLMALPSIVCNAIANLLFVRALQLSDLSLTIPYLSLTPVLALFSGWIVVGESPEAMGILGVVIIGVGALTLNPYTTGESGFHPIRALRSERGSLAMLGVACLWSVSVAFDKRALMHGSPITHSAVLAVSGAVILEIFRRRVSTERLLLRLKPVTLLLGVTTLVIMAALVAQLWAYQYVPVAYVEAIKRSLGMVGAVVVGWWFFQEGSLRRRLTAVVVMAAGVTLILMGG